MNKKPYAPAAQSFTNYAQLVEAVARDAGSIGYSSMGLAEHTAVKAVSIQGISPTVISVNEDLYPYARTLWLYTNKAKETAATQDFIRFVQSKAGQEVLYKMGFVRRFERRLTDYLDD